MITSIFFTLRNYWPRVLPRPLVFHHIASIIVLAIIGLISYGSFYAPILHSDDWSIMVGRWYSDNLNWFDLSELRPLLKLPLLILYSLFGLNIHAFYAVLWTLNLIAASQLYFLMLKLIPKNAAIALGIAAIFLVYPADFTHMWLTMIMIRFVVVLTLMYAYLLLVYSDTGNGWTLGGALLCLALPFGIYEGQLGVAMTWAVLLTLMKRASSWQKWPTLLLPVVVGLIFVLWRTIGYSIVGIEDNNGYVDRLQLTPAVIMTRFIMGYRVMIWAWVEPLLHASSLNEGQVLVIILVAITLFGFLAYLISRVHHKLPNHYLTQLEYLDQVRRFMVIVVIGSVFIAAGYIPIITVFEPTIFFQVGSRVNGFALPGAAVTTVCLLVLVVLLLKRKWKQQEINFVGVAALAPLLFLGIMVQARVQYDHRIAWEEQKHLWHQLFELVPDLKDGTSIYFLLSESKNQDSSLNITEQRLPLNTSWEVPAALNILYGKYSLGGDVFVRELLHKANGLILRELLLREGIKNYLTGEITPYDQALFVTYDNELRQLTIVEDLAAEDLVNFSVPTYAPYERIIETPTRRVGLRWLVGATW